MGAAVEILQREAWSLSEKGTSPPEGMALCHRGNKAGVVVEVNAVIKHAPSAALLFFTDGISVFYVHAGARFAPGKP
ncbi:MAG: hypothetical protein ACLRWQ_13210 [Flavonifractor plautii]